MKNKSKNKIALIIGICIALFILELFLKYYNPIIFRQQGDKISLPANIKYTYKNEKIKGVDSIIIHTKNKLGFRGKEKPLDFENWTSIIAVGGSTTECRFITDGKDWPILLEKKLSNDFNNIWINNAGLDGHSTFGHQILLEDYLIKTKPKYILFLIGSNDVGRKDLGVFDNNHLKKAIIG